MNIITTCFIVTFIIVYIIDWTSAPRNMLARFLSVISKNEVSPNRVKLPYLAQCSLCCSFWVTAILLLIFNWKMLPLAFICSYTTKPILYLYNIIDLTIDKIYKIIYNLINKI